MMSPDQPRPIPAKTALLVGLLFAVHVLAVWNLIDGGLLSRLFNDSMHRVGPGTDFVVYYQAGLRVWQGASPYGEGVALGYRYHPLFAILFGATFSRVPLKAAFLLWLLMDELLLFYLWRRLRLAGLSDAAFIFGSALLLLAAPYLLELYMGQATFLAACLAYLAFIQYGRDRHLPFVLLMAASIIVKPVALLFLFLPIVQARWRQAVEILLVVVVLAVPYFLFDPGGLAAVLEVNTKAVPAGAGWVIHAGSQGLHAFIVRVLVWVEGIPTARLASYDDLPPASRLIVTAWPLLLSLCSLYLSWVRRKDLEIIVFIWGATYILGYKDVWEHCYSFLVPIFVMLAAGREKIPRWMLAACAVLIAMPTGFVFYDPALPPGPVDPEHHWGIVVSLLHHLTRPLPVAVVYGYLFFATLKGVRRPVSSGPAEDQR